MNANTWNAADEAGPNHTYAVAIFGRDEQNKAHASRFEAAEAALAVRAAGLMGMRALRLITAEQQELGAKLPAAKAFESGRAFCPFSKTSIFDLLAADPAAFTPERPADADVSPAAPRKPKGGRPARAAAAAATRVEEALSGPAAPPADRDGIAVGHRVLAAEENLPSVWYLAEVTALKSPELLQLVWVGDQYAGEPPIVRHRDHLALLPVAIAATLK